MQYICSKTGDEGSIYAAKQGMRACNNSNPIIKDVGRGYACYYCCMPSSPVLLHIYCPHPLSCCIYTALVSLLFGTVVPTSFNILMEMFLLSCFTGFSLYRNSCMPCYVSIKAYKSTVQEFCTAQ